MNESKPYILPEENPDIVEESVVVRTPVNADINSLRHDLTDAIYATNNQQILYTCLIYLHNQNPVKEDIKAKMLARLADLEHLESGWDGEGSLPVNATSLAISRKTIRNVCDDLLENWVLFPDARGFVYWDYTHGKDIAGITIAPDKMVAFVKKDGQLHKYDFAHVTCGEILNILEEVHG